MHCLLSTIAAITLGLASVQHAHGADQATVRANDDRLPKTEEVRDEIRNRAINDASDSGRAGVPYLIETLKSHDLGQRAAAAEALARNEAERGFIVEALVSTLDDPNKDVRIIGTETLGSIGPAAAAAVPKLIEKFKDPYLRWPVRQALVAIGATAIIPIVKAVRSPDHLVRRGALETISLMSSDRRFTDSLTASVVDVDLIRPDSSIGSIASVDALAEILIATLKDPEDDVRRAATTTLGHLQRKAPAATAALLQSLADPDSGVRANARKALQKLQPPPCNEFLDALADTDRNVYEAASVLLEQCLPLPNTVTPYLLQLLNSTAPDHSLVASNVFEYLSSSAALELLPHLDSPNGFVRRGVARALFLLPSPPDQTIGMIGRALADPDDVVRDNALDSLQKLLAKSTTDPASLLAISKLTTTTVKPLLTDKNHVVRAHAAEVIGLIGPTAKGAVPALEAALDDPDAAVRQNSARSLGEIGDAHAIHSLILALRDPNNLVVSAAASSLGKFGSAAASALVDLSSLQRGYFTDKEIGYTIKIIAEALESDMRKLSDDELRHAIGDLAQVLSQGGFPEAEKAAKRSEAALTNQLSSRLPIMQRAYEAVLAVVVLLLLYGAALPFFILAYPLYPIARTAVNSGFFRLPLLHRTILNMRWSRRRLFRQAARLELDAFELPSYIGRTIHGVSMPEAPIKVSVPGDTLKQVFLDRRHAMVCGRSGTGKSVLLRHIAAGAAEHFLNGYSSEVPILIDFRTAQIAGRALLDHIKDRLRKAEIRLPSAVLEHLVDHGGFLILVDSLNDPSETEVKSQLNAFLNQDSANRVLLASQNNFLKRPDITLFSLEAIASDQAMAYLKQRLGIDVWDKLPMDAKRLAASPQDLAILADVIDKDNPGAVPSRRAALYRRLLKKDSVFADNLEVYNSQIQALFGLGFALLKREPPVIRAGELGTLARRELASQGAEPADAAVRFVVDAVSRSSLFRTEFTDTEAGEELLTFRHELVGKYISAQHLLLRFAAAKSEEALDEFIELAFDRRWQDVFAFFVEELEDGEKLNLFLGKLLDRRRKRESRSIAQGIVATALATRDVNEEIRDRFSRWKIEDERLDQPTDEDFVQGVVDESSVI